MALHRSYVTLPALIGIIASVALVDFILPARYKLMRSSRNSVAHQAAGSCCAEKHSDVQPAIPLPPQPPVLPSSTVATVTSGLPGSISSTSTMTAPVAAVAVAPPAPPAPSTAGLNKVQNHIYKLEASTGSSACEYDKQDEELAQHGWDAEKYPWHVVGAGNLKGKRRLAVLYGTAYAQRLIWDHQNPASCNGAKYLIYHQQSSGVGSNLHLVGQALALALHLGRIFVLPRWDGGFQYMDSSHCPGAHTWECYFQSFSKCSPEGNSDVLEVDTWSMEVPGFNHIAVPAVFQEMIDRCSPLKHSDSYYWWRAQSITYMVRFNARTRQVMDKYRSDILYVRKAGSCEEVKADPNILLQGGSMMAFVRHGDKGIEAHLYPWSDYYKEMDRLANGEQDIRVLYKEVAETNETFEYDRQTYAPRVMFVSSEDPAVVDSALELCKGSPGKAWSIVYTKMWRENVPEKDRLQANSVAKSTIEAFLNLELSLEADAWVCTLSSNWCRLIDELRMTIGRKASHPYISLTRGGFPKESPCPPERRWCYLGW